MGESKAMVYIVVGILGITAAALAFAGEATRIKKSDIIITSNGCNYKNTIADLLGYIALAATITALIIITWVTKWGGYYRKPPEPQATGKEICSFIMSWFAWSIGTGLLFNAAYRSSRQESLRATVRCNIVRVPPGVFAVGGIFSLVGCVLGLFSYRASTKYNAQPALSGIVMGSPQFDNTSMNPYIKQHQHV